MLKLASRQAGGRKCHTLERIAINIDDARIPDNDDFQPIDEAIHLDRCASCLFFNLYQLKNDSKCYN